jgi:glutamate-1-semialdehyde 2,1-aminomutase
LYAGQHEGEVLLAEQMQRIIPCAELVRFSNSGSEALHTAFRLARAYTGRTKILKFEGHYHGWFDNILYSLAPTPEQAGPREHPNVVPSSLGQPASAEDDLIVMPWNDLELVHQTLAAYGDQIAAVVLEPIMCNTSVILPRPGYLEALRQACTAHGVVLIFDEIVTGFRVALGGAQAYFGVIPDLAVFGKAMAAGFPISCIAGRTPIMEQVNNGTVNHSGTFNTNVICTAAALSTLTILEEEGDELYHKIHQRGELLMSGFQEVAEEYSLPLAVQGVGAIFHVAFTESPGIFDYRDYWRCDTKRYAQLVVALAEQNIRVVPRGVWYLSAAHTQDDVAETLEGFEKALSAIR